ERTVELMDELGVLPVLLPEIRAFLDGHLPGAEQPLPEEALPENAELLKRHLRALDRMIQERPVSDEVVLGALLYTPLNRTLEQDDDSGRDRNRAIANFLSSIGTRINLTRRLSEHLKQIFLAQRSLLPATNGASAPGKRRRRRRVNVAALVRKPFFDDAVDLLEIHLNALEKPTDIVDSWRAKAEAIAEGRGNIDQHPAHDVNDDETNGEMANGAHTNGEAANGDTANSQRKRRRRRPRRKKSASSAADHQPGAPAD
ncbi:MAG: hypothetical protein AAFV29_10550, partial [Myxococcota bacterium]